MKNRMKTIFAFSIGLIISVVVVYAEGIDANNISYNGKTLKEALDYLYSAPQVQKFCEYKDNTYVKQESQDDPYAIGTKYECYVNSEEHYYFYVLAVNNGNTVDLIMDRNITQGLGTGNTMMNWTNAMNYIDNNLKSSWTNILDVDLPKAQDIANAADNGSWKAAASSAWWCLETKVKDQANGPTYCYNNTTTKLWLWDYMRDCTSWHCDNNLASPEALGYWTRDAVVNTTYAWNVDRRGGLTRTGVSDASSNGIRPVITVLKGNLYESD